MLPAVSITSRAGVTTRHRKWIGTITAGGTSQLNKVFLKLRKRLPFIVLYPHSSLVSLFPPPRVSLFSRSRFSVSLGTFHDFGRELYSPVSVTLYRAILQ